MNSMENFFNWMITPISKEEVILWFNAHNMFYERIELYGDIFKSLNIIIMDTYMGDETSETKISLSQEDKNLHFEWCWNRVIDDFQKENVIIKLNGDHRNYVGSFFMDTFYNQSEKKFKNSISKFLNDMFDMEKPFSKSDLDILTEIYKLMEKNIE